MSQLAIDKLKEKFAAAVVESHAQHGNETAVVDPARVVEVCTFLRDEPALAFDQLIDLTVLDTAGLARRPGSHAPVGETGRFEVVYHLRSTKTGRRVRIKARVDEGDAGEAPAIASVVPVWIGANWLEREAWDMFGVKFTGHPDLRRILMYEEFIGHPLRKDYPKDKRQPLVRRDFD